MKTRHTAAEVRCRLRPAFTRRSCKCLPMWLYRSGTGRQVFVVAVRTGATQGSRAARHPPACSRRPSDGQSQQDPFNQAQNTWRSVHEGRREAGEEEGEGRYARESKDTQVVRQHLRGWSDCT